MVTAQPKLSGEPPLTQLMTQAMAKLSQLPAARQDELARMLIDVTESDRLLTSGELSLTPEQWAEVEAAMSDDEPYATDQEVEAFFTQYRTQ